VLLQTSFRGYMDVLKTIVLKQRPTGSALADLFMAASRSSVFDASIGQTNDVLEFLIDYGANLDIATSESDVPVMVVVLGAASLDDNVAKGFVSDLVAKGAPVNVMAPNGKCPVSLAVDNMWPETLKFLFHAGAEYPSWVECVTVFS
jgi:hypothetical protein